MDTDFEIELQDENVKETAGGQLPLNFLTFGEIESDDVKVYIKQDVYKALEKLSLSDTTKELGSILLGNYCQEHGKTHVILSHYIEAKYTDASASTLTFTHDTWDYVHKTHAQKLPEQKIVGWQHTHPNYGIFLSNYDMFIQENFFDLPFQVAYVIDPIQNLRGFFQWKNGRVEKLKGYYVYDDVSKPIKIEQLRVKQDKPKTPKAAKVAIGLLCVATVALSCFALSVYQKYEKQMEKQEQILADITTQQQQLEAQQAEIEAQQSQITQQNQQLQTQADDITRLEGLLSDGILDAAGQVTATDLLQMLENNQLTLENQDAIIAQLKLLTQYEPDGKAVTFQAYTVAPGDTLYSICQCHGMDYDAIYLVILGINGIRNADLIEVGQTLLLPILPS